MEQIMRAKIFHLCVENFGDSSAITINFRLDLSDFISALSSHMT